MRRGAELEGVLGVAFRRGDEIVKNPPRPLIEDLDALPFPARELLHDQWSYRPPPGTYRRKPVTVLMTARGCDRNCLFCFQIDRKRRAGVRGLRLRSVENVLAEIEHCLALGYREIKFLDDTLAADYDRALQIALEIKRRRLDFTWFASACVNQVDARLLRAFKEAGCWAILLGAESGVQKNLNTLRKGATLDQIRAAVRAAKATGLRVSMPFLFGIPGETYEDGLKTIEFALELDPDLANFHCDHAVSRDRSVRAAREVRHDLARPARLHLPGRGVRAVHHDARATPRAAPARVPAFLLAAGVSRARAAAAAQHQRPARRGGRCQEPVLAVGASRPVSPGTRAGARPGGSRRYSLASAG